MYVLSERWLIHLRSGYSQPVPTSAGRTLVFAWSTKCTLFKTQSFEKCESIK